MRGVKKAFEIIEHPADVGFIAYGSTWEELLENAALAMLALGCELATVEEREQREIKARGADAESLLFDWLADVLAAADAEGLVFRRVQVTQASGDESGAGSGKARGVAYGEKFDRARHRAGTYIKAVTYHQLAVEKTGEGWRARVYLDV